MNTKFIFCFYILLSSHSTVWAQNAVVTPAPAKVSAPVTATAIGVAPAMTTPMNAPVNEAPAILTPAVTPTPVITNFEAIDVDLVISGDDDDANVKFLKSKKRDITAALKKTWGKWLPENIPTHFSMPATPKRLRVKWELSSEGVGAAMQIQISGTYSLEDQNGEFQLAHGSWPEIYLRPSLASAQSVESQIATQMYHLGIRTFGDWGALLSSQDFKNQDLDVVGDVGFDAISLLTSALENSLGDKSSVRPTSMGISSAKILLRYPSDKNLLAILQGLNSQNLEGKYRPSLASSQQPYKIKLVKEMTP